ncbi:calcium/sodium antiporter [Gaopeijia maritima]|uniref:Calcium/sodium antiporter n=1 Tax=Gaopeijia maritima TaxID=3119007 RepID=A0ABU9E663_9BACT
MTVVVLVVGALALFVIGARALLVGASLLAHALRVSPLLIGLTVLPFATSTPELIVSIDGAWAGQSELAIGNIVGTNTFNVLFILGLLALIARLPVSSSVVRKEVPIMIGASFLMWALSHDGHIGRVDGAVLLFAMVAHLKVLHLASVGGDSGRSHALREPAGIRGALPGIGLVILGGGLLALSAQTVVDVAISAATDMGMSPHSMGLSFIAIGTSLPELATTIVAVRRSEYDLAVGNVVGSNIFNVLTILGVTALTSPEGVVVPPALIAFDVPVMIASAMACYPMVRSGRVIDRREGAVLFGGYLAYGAYGWFYAAHHAPSFTQAMLFFAIPLLAATIAVSGRTGVAQPPPHPNR